VWMGKLLNLFVSYRCSGQHAHEMPRESISEENWVRWDLGCCNDLTLYVCVVAWWWW
jgi:hypothetical protein